MYFSNCCIGAKNLSAEKLQLGIFLRHFKCINTLPLAMDGMTQISISLAVWIASAPIAAQAQQQPVIAGARPGATVPQPAPDDSGDGGDIIVQGQRNLPGSVIGDIPPDQQLGPADIRSYGVSSVNDLLAALGPQTRSGGGGPPVVLLNGRRIAGFTEIRDLPTEAILRVDILPEEVALKYGYRSDQRVINFVLRPRFQSVTTEFEARAATEGGRATPSGEFDVLKITRSGRINLHVEYEESSALTEAERGIRFPDSPFAVAGNVVGTAGGEIDPALSLRAGEVATIAGVPVVAATRAATLAEFAGGAGRATVTDPTPFRTLLPAGRSFSANGIYATTVFGNINATFNARLETNDTRATFGLHPLTLTLPAGNPFSPFSRAVTVDRLLDTLLPLGQQNKIITTHLGATFSGNVKSWQWSLIGNFDQNDVTTLTDVGVDSAGFQARLQANDPLANPFGPIAADQIAGLPVNRASSRLITGGVDALANGNLFRLPAGPVAASMRLSGQTIGFDSETQRFGVAQSAQLSRTVGNGQLNFDFPLTSRSKNVLGAIGSLSANFNIGYDQLSDFGGLRTIGYGLNWAPVEAFRLIASVSDREVAPTQQQLGNPVITTPNVRVFDFARGQTATVTTLSGGNGNLLAESRRVNRLGVTIKPLDKTDLVFTASYTDTRTNNALAGFPSATVAIEGAFPQRFQRDPAGQLLRIDNRAINFAETSRSELRWGINFSMSIKSKIQKQIEAFRAGKGPNPFVGLTPPTRTVFGDPITFGRPGGGPPGATASGGPGAGAGGGRPGGGFGGGGFGGGGFGGGGGGRGGPGGGRLQFAIYHTVHLTEQVRVGTNGPVLDLLSGDTIGNGGGQPRHEIEFQSGYNNNGLGARLSGNWASGTRVNTGGAATGPLNFSDLATVNLRLFADLGQRLDLIKKRPWMRGMRVVVSIDNVLNARQQVSDATGVTPIAYQPAYLDPLGRSVRISIRKLFF